MKYFPVKSAIFCLLVTPILYLFTLNLLQESLTDYYHQKIENIYIGDSSKLLSGSLTVEEQIGQNIYSYINSNKLIHYTNLDLSIIITSKAGKIIFPAYIVLDEIADNLTVEQMDTESTAKYNFQILNDGLNLTVNVNLNNTSILTLLTNSHIHSAIIITSEVDVPTLYRNCKLIPTAASAFDLTSVYSNISPI